MSVGRNFVTSFLWDLPSPAHGIARSVLGGWQTNGILSSQSGLPFSVVSGQDIALAGTGTQRPNLIGDPHLDTGRARSRLIQQYFNPAAFALPATGAYGNAGRNILTGPGSWNLDFGLFKRTRVTERAELQFRWELFNALNHANLLNPNNIITAPLPGVITSTTGPRIMQFALKLAL
jgi:hypothetical protein